MFSGLPFCRAFVVMSFQSESVDFVMDFCEIFFCVLLGAFRPFKRRTENPQRNPQQDSRQNPCKIHASLDVPIRGAQFATDRIAPIRRDLKSHDSNRNPKFRSIRSDFFALFSTLTAVIVTALEIGFFSRDQFLSLENTIFKGILEPQKCPRLKHDYQNTIPRSRFKCLVFFFSNRAIRFARFGSLADPDSNRAHRDI